MAAKVASAANAASASEAARVRHLVERSAAKAEPVLHGASPGVEASLPSLHLRVAKWEAPLQRLRRCQGRAGCRGRACASPSSERCAGAEAAPVHRLVATSAAEAAAALCLANIPMHAAFKNESLSA